MDAKNLDDWLAWIKALQIKAIDLSLERATAVAGRMGLLHFNCPVVTVAGTNGKGSTVAALEAVYLAAGRKVAAFTSPYLFQFNEQVKIQGVPVADHVLCSAFAEIAAAATERLTTFEFTTLAALLIFQRANVDICLLEVGLGGRYDAVNVVAADIAIVTSIGIDHVEWLGNTREAIAYEKAGIFRPQKVAICGDPSPPRSLIDYAAHLKTQLFCQQQEFGFVEHPETWTWWGLKQRWENLPLPTLLLQNMSTVLMAVERLQDKLPLEREIIERGLVSAALTGRIEVIPGKVFHIFDVSHNPAAVSQLADYLIKRPCNGKTRAVFSMLTDKDIYSTILAIKDQIDDWHVAPIQHERGASLTQLTHCLFQAKVGKAADYLSIIDAYHAATLHAQEGDRIVVFGSFHTVAQVRRAVMAPSSLG